jgi:hypothetical protein
MTYQSFIQSNHAIIATRRRPIDKQYVSDLDLSTDGFNIWWNKTFARHTKVVADAWALMRTHQRVGASAGLRSGQSH